MVHHLRLQCRKNVSSMLHNHDPTRSDMMRSPDLAVAVKSNTFGVFPVGRVPLRLCGSPPQSKYAQTGQDSATTGGCFIALHLLCINEEKQSRGMCPMVIVCSLLSSKLFLFRTFWIPD